MAGRVIQGFFTDGGRLSRAVSDRTSAVAQRVAAPARAVHAPGPPAAAFAGRAGAIQQRGAPGRPPLAHGGVASPVQRFGGDGSFAIDPVQVGLARSGGIPLPKPVLAKMETAFGADFSAVRVHVGPQASRIGAIAFTTGNDLYFAPGQFQPDNVKGQQLIGHELAHVIQQRAGRVRAPSGGVAVVQDRMLEAEADRLGMHAAMHGGPLSGRPGMAAMRKSDPARSIQQKIPAHGAVRFAHPATSPMRARAADHRYGAIQRSQDMSVESYGGGHSRKFFVLSSDWEKSVKKKSATKINKMYSSGEGVSEERSYDDERARQMLRWISSLIFKMFPKAVEIQSYFHKNTIYISSNVTSVNKKLVVELESGLLAVLKTSLAANFPQNWDWDFQKRVYDHGRKLLSKSYYDGQEGIWSAIKKNSVSVPLEDYTVDLHAERRIQEHLKIQLDYSMLGGVKRACAVCAVDLDLVDDVNAGPLWPSSSALGGYSLEPMKKKLIKEKIHSHVTSSKRMKKNGTPKYTTDYDSDSDSDADDY